MIPDLLPYTTGNNKVKLLCRKYIFLISRNYTLLLVLKILLKLSNIVLSFILFHESCMIPLVTYASVNSQSVTGANI